MENHLADSIISFMKNNICNNITISDICAHMNYGKTFLCTTFKNATGFSVKEYYIKLKIDYAKILIREKNYNISQISNLLMFDNAHYFSRVFKRITKMTPTEYLNTIKVG
jgi:YesN/AraC family two-component response regulator